MLGLLFSLICFVLSGLGQVRLSRAGSALLCSRACSMSLQHGLDCYWVDCSLASDTGTQAFKYHRPLFLASHDRQHLQTSLGTLKREMNYSPQGQTHPP